MNTITHDGQTYEALTYEAAKANPELVVAVKTSTGTRWIAQANKDDIHVQNESGFWVRWDDAESLGIQPLRLVPKEPVTFEASVVVGTFHGDDVTMLLAPKMPLGKRFRCVEIVEEQA